MPSNAPTTDGSNPMPSPEPPYALPEWPPQARWEKALPWIVCALLTLAVIVGYASVAPETRCRDGYASESIGSRGACSHHGGVDQTWNELGLLTLLLGPAFGLLAGYGVHQKLERRSRRTYRDRVRSSPPPSDSDISAVLSYARAAEMKVEVLHKGPADYEPRWKVLDYGAAKTPALEEGTAWRPKQRRVERGKSNPGITVAVRLVRE